MTARELNKELNNIIHEWVVNYYNSDFREVVRRAARKQKIRRLNYCADLNATYKVVMIFNKIYTKELKEKGRVEQDLVEEYQRILEHLEHYKVYAPPATPVMHAEAIVMAIGKWKDEWDEVKRKGIRRE